MLEDASIKVSAVASSVTTVSVRWMLEALIDGEADPAVLADLAKGKMHVKIPDLIEALTGSFDAHHARLGSAMLRRLGSVERAEELLGQVIDAAFVPWQHQLELLSTIPGVGTHTGQVIRRDRRRHDPLPHRGTAGRVGGGAPGVHESAGYRRPSAARHGNSGSLRPWSRPPAPRREPRTGTLPRSTPGWLGGARPSERRSPSHTRSSLSRPTTCSSMIGVTAALARLATAASRRGPGSSARRTARTIRSHRNPRPGRLIKRTSDPDSSSDGSERSDASIS